MWWSWWGAMFVVGVALGCIGAWTTNAARVFMKTLAVPLTFLIAHLAFRSYAPPLNAVPLLVVDLVVMVLGAFLGDYLLGLKLGRHGPDGYRRDSVGH